MESALQDRCDHGAATTLRVSLRRTATIRASSPGASCQSEVTSTRDSAACIVGTHAASDLPDCGDDAHEEAVRVHHEMTERDAELRGRDLLAMSRAAAASGDAGAARALLTAAAGSETPRSRAKPRLHWPLPKTPDADALAQRRSRCADRVDCSSSEGRSSPFGPSSRGRVA